MREQMTRDARGSDSQARSMLMDSVRLINGRMARWEEDLTKAKSPRNAIEARALKVTIETDGDQLRVDADNLRQVVERFNRDIRHTELRPVPLPPTVPQRKRGAR